MAITIVTAAESTSLTTVETVRAQLGTDPDPALDAVIEQCIRAASLAIVRYCGRDFAYQKITETMPSNGSQFLRTSKFPLITSPAPVIAYQGTTVDSADYSIDDPLSGCIFNAVGWYNTYNVFDYSITYWFGYILPTYIADSNLPEDIEMAAIILAKNMYFARKHDLGIRSEKVPDVYEVEYINAALSEARSTTLTVEVRELLNPYQMFKV